MNAEPDILKSTYARQELVLFARETDVGGDVIKREIGDAMNAGDHAIHDVQLPPGASPALLDDGAAAPVGGGELARVEANLDGEPLRVGHELVGARLVAAAVLADGQQQQGLGKEPIPRAAGVVGEADGLVKVLGPGGARVKVQGAKVPHGRQEVFELGRPFPDDPLERISGQHARVRGVEVLVKGRQAALGHAQLAPHVRRARVVGVGAAAAAAAAAGHEEGVPVQLHVGPHRRRDELRQHRRLGIGASRDRAARWARAEEHWARVVVWCGAWGRRRGEALVWIVCHITLPRALVPTPRRDVDTLRGRSHAAGARGCAVTFQMFTALYFCCDVDLVVVMGRTRNHTRQNEIPD